MRILTEKLDSGRRKTDSDEICDGSSTGEVRPLPVPRSGRGPLKCPLFETSKVGNPIYECLRLKRGMTSKYRVLYNVPWKPNALEWIEFPDFLKCADAGGLEK
jgi:hypothetical protein